MLKRIALPVLVVALVLVFTIVVCGATPWIFIDIPSFVLVPLAPLLFLGLSSGWKGFGAAFSSAVRPGASRRDLSSSVQFFKSLGAAIWSFGAMGTMTGFIVVLCNLADKAKLGPNLAVALITMFYAAVFNLLIVLPFLAAARKRLAETE